MEEQTDRTRSADQDFCETAWRNAILINPDNPQAVAESIGDWHKALKAIASCKSIIEGDVVDIAQKALAKAKEGKG